MNVDEARVPNVDPDWSIEIYLFSNGQQFSPPRKYYLRADDLDSWQATLNYLATSHYGLQCPQISLFTTDGQLVEGPLGLNGGQAYVAVVEPDRFVDTGYQKYLIKASRSWEKRQARKNVTECVPDKPSCCICPEKEWCCDPNTCCICVENEDSYSQYPLLHTSENLELRPADDQYISSTRTKPVARGDFGPGSGGIGPTLGEHEVRLGEHETDPVEYRYSPVPAPAKPYQYGAGLSVNGSTPAEQAPKLSGNKPRPGEYRVKSDESGTKLDASRPSEYEGNMSDHPARFNQSRAEPGEYGAKTNEYGSRLSHNGEKPVENLATLSENEPRLSKGIVKPGVYGARPSQNVPKPADYQNKPSPNGVRPDEYGTRPGAYKPKPIGKGVTPDKHGAKPGEYETRSNRNEARLGEFISKPSVNKAKPRENVPRASEYKPKSNGNGDKLSEHGVIPREHETRPSVNRVQPGEYGTKPGKYAARPNEYETRPSVNGFRPGEHEARPGEHETRPSINRAKPGDSEATSGKNEVWSGEDVDRPTVYGSRAANKNNTRRISGQRDTDIQQGGRTGEPTREFEHGGRVGEQKGRETNLAGRAGGQRVRLSEQRNKQSDLLPRLGGQESKLDDLEAKLMDHRLRTIDRDTSLENPASRVTEPSSRTAAPVSRPTPRDRINSRVRSSDLGQPKSRIPTRIDESAARLDDSGIKNTLGHPRARPGSAGGTAVAGVLHTSEAQQHARKSSFFAGRPSTEKKHLPISQNSTLLKKPTLISSALRKLEDKKPIKTKQENLTKKTNEKTIVFPAPAFNDVLKSKTLLECNPVERTQHEFPLLTISVTNVDLDITTNKAPLENTIEETDLLIGSKHSFQIKSPESEMTTSMRFDSVKYFVDSINNSPDETQTEIIYIGKSTASMSMSVNVEVQNSTESVDTKRHAQEESASNKAKVDSGTFHYSTEAVDTKQQAQEESASKNVKADSETFQTSTEAVDIKQHVQEKTASNKTKVNSDTFQTSAEVVATKQHAQEESASNKAKVNSDTFEYNTGGVDTEQHAQENSASNKIKVDSDACCLCRPRDHKLGTEDSDESTIPILYQGDGGTINLKLDIKIRNIVKSVYSCQKNCQGVRSVANLMTSEKESQISIEDNFLLRRDSFNSLFHKDYSLGYGFDFSPNVMVVQCAGCGRLNNPPGCDPPQCCDNNKKYFVLLTNSVDEDMNDSCDCNPPLKKLNSVIPVKKCCSEMNNSQNLETITTVTVSGVPLPKREMKKCNLKNSSCQTEETHECMSSKHKVSITEESITTETSEIQKKCSSSSVSLTAKHSCLKNIQEICPAIKEDESSLVCCQTDPVPCQKVPSTCTKVPSECTKENSHTCPKVPPACTKVNSNKCPKLPPICPKVSSACTKVNSHICPKVQSKGCQQTCPPVQKQGCSCSKVSSTCPSCYPQQTCPPVQTQGCSPVSSTCPSCKPQQTCPPVQGQGCSPVSSTCPSCKPQHTCPPVQTQGCSPVSSTCPSCKPQHTCPPVQTQGCSPVSSTCPSCKPQQTCPPVQTQGCSCSPVASTCPSCYPMPLACIQIQTHVCPHGPQVSNMETQTQWKSLVLEARLHCDGRYSFHLPPLNVLNNFPF